VWDGTVPVIALAIIFSAVIIAGTIAWASNEHRSSVITFLGTLSGAVTAFYFKRRPIGR
jgi:hypothetical protein